MPQGHVFIHRETDLQLSSMRVLAIGKKQTNKQTSLKLPIYYNMNTKYIKCIKLDETTRCLRLVKKSSSVPLLFSALVTRVNTFNHNV